MPVRKVTDPSILQQLGNGSVVAPNPMFPGQMQAQQLGIQEKQATLPFAAPKAAAEASNAATQAQVNAATAPSDIASKRGQAQKSSAEGQSAQTNLQVSGGADNTQAKSAAFYTRALRANQLYGGTGVNDDPQGREIAKSLLPDALVNQFTSPARQQAEAAQRDFIASTLRYESGAAISNSEFDNQRKIYFPQPGDSPETVALKAKLRENAIEGLRLSAGPAAPKVEGADFSGMTGGPQQTVATGVEGRAQDQTYRNVSDPGATAALSAFIKRGAPYQDVAAYAQAHGFNPPPPEDYAAGVAFAKTHRGAVNAEALKTIPTTVGQRLSASPASSFLAGGVTGATAGLSDVAGRSLVGPTWDANRAALAATNPMADLAGNVAGQAGFEGLIGKLGGSILAKPLARRGVDLGYGATMGASQNPDDPAISAGEGAIVNTLGGMVGRGAQRAVGKTLSGVKNAHLQYLDNRGVPLTLGQIARGSDNTFGHAVGGIEERMAGMPVADAIIGTARRRGDQGFNNELFRQIAPGVTDTGAEGLAQAAAAESGAYAKLGPVRIATDPAFDQGLSAVEQAAKGLNHHAGDVQTVIGDVRSQINNGELTGKGYQTALQAIRKTRSSLNDDVGGKAKDALNALEAEVQGLGARQGGQVAQDLAAANAIHGRIKTVESALEKAQSQNNDELISPRALNQASIANTKKFFGPAKALSPDRPFYELTDAGKAVMPNLTPDSGTAGRAMLLSYLAGGVTGGGLGFAGADKGQGAEGAEGGALKGLTLAALLAAPYSKVGQKVIQKTLLGDRPRKITKLGDFLINHDAGAGILAQALARRATIQNQ
jgi:hypothetical protein